MTGLSMAGANPVRRARTWWQSVPVLVAIDLALLAVCTLAGALLALGRLDIWRLPETHSFLWTLAASGLFWSWLTHSQWRFLNRPSVTGGLFIAAAVLATTAAVTLLGRGYFSRTILLTLALAYPVLLVSTRMLGRRFARLPRVILVAGSGSLAPRISESPTAEVVATYPAGGVAPRDPPAVDAIAVDLHESLSRPVAAWVARCSAAGVPVVSTITLYETLAWRIPLSEIPEDRLPLDFVRGASLYRPFKRGIDVTAGLVLALPALLVGGLVALAVLIADGRPVLLRQRRVGEGGRVFAMLKFRTMRVDAEADGPQQALDGDPRIIGGGAFLRKFRLDELPQLWNVLVGEMSLIGPRPERPEFVEEYRERLPYYELRHAVKPGISGWAQVQQGYAAGAAETATKLEYDLYYVKHASFWLDLYIALRTVRTILSGFGSR